MFGDVLLAVFIGIFVLGLSWVVRSIVVVRGAHEVSSDAALRADDGDDNDNEP